MDEWFDNARKHTYTCFIRRSPPGLLLPLFFFWQVAPLALEMDRKGAMDPSLLKKLFEVGLMGCEVEEGKRYSMNE